MNYLNKIIFINSASIKYAEINLNGHIHLIGTQGVGKSTVLRAMLFFYNADTAKLGILVNKKSYAEYYFQYFDSYIVYEVARAEGNYCVLSYKMNQRVMFRFIDAPYSKDFFIDDAGNVPTDWKGIATRLGALKVTFSAKIDSYIEYKNILYGAIASEKEKNEWKRYCLLKSEQYQNIPKTIQNIFLNAKVDANFIKQTLIASLEDENPMQNIRLDTYRMHLKDFKEQLKDIRQFRAAETMAAAAKIKENYAYIHSLDQKKITLAKEFIWAIAALDKHEPQLKAHFKQGEVDEKNILNQLETLKTEFAAKRTELKEKIAVQNSVLETIDKKKKYYEEQRIQFVIERVQRKQELLLDQKGREIEKKRLTDNYNSISEKYNILLQDNEHDLKNFENDKGSQKNEIEAQFLAEQIQIHEDANLAESEIKAVYQTEVVVLSSDIDDKKQIINNLNIEKNNIQYKSFFQTEIEAHQIELQKQEALIREADRSIENALKMVKQLKTDLQTKEKDLKQTLNLKKQKIEFLLENTEKRFGEVNLNWQNRQNSLFGWLTEQYPNWENTIGKVILDNEQVLFNPNLLPRFSAYQTSLSFYGIELDLNAIQRKVKTLADYEAEKSALEKSILNSKTDISNLESTFYKDKEIIEKEHARKIKKEQDVIQSQQYELVKATPKVKEAKIELEKWKKAAIAERTQQSENIQSALVTAEWQLSEAKKILQLKKETYEQQLKQSNTDKVERIKARKNIKSQNIQKINELINDKKSKFKIKEAQLKFEMQQELSNEGADTTRLDAINKRLKTIQNGLDYIEENQALVILYERDKLELFDKLADFTRAKTGFETRLELAKKQFEGDKIFINNDLHSIIERNSKTKEALKQIENDRQLVRQFKLSDVYKKLQDLFQSPTEAVETLKTCDELSRNLLQIHQDWKSSLDELKKNIRIFLDPFTENNILKFNKQLNTDDVNSFFQFAKSLDFFMEEQKIEHYEKIFNQKFGDIVKSIGNEIKTLVSKEDSLRKTTNSINRDFKNKGFASVIKEIELEIDDNITDEIVTMLKTIRKFNDEHITPFTDNNLFSDAKTNKNMEKAIQLVEKFIEKLGKDSREMVSLSDCFTLSFRIKENDNDTGKIDNLSNVGSAGTDVIVKALLNIALLNEFKEKASKKAKTFQLHCMMDEIGMLHPTNMRGILKFAEDRNIFLINGSPIATDVQAYKHVYILEKDSRNITKVKKLLTNNG